jgi:hypothetical protein
MLRYPILHPHGTNMPANADNALKDILEMFGSEYWNISFTDDGRAELTRLFAETLGKYFADLETDNPGRDLWGDPTLKEMPNFILGYAVAQIAIALKNVSGNRRVDGPTFNVVARGVMRDAKTEENCAFMLKSYLKKLNPRAATPICDGVRAKGEKDENIRSETERPGR